MTLLTAADIASMRTTLDQSLPDTAIVQRGTVTSDSGGGGSTTWANHGTFSCRLSPLAGGEREIADRLAADAKWLVSLPAGTDVGTNDRLAVGTETFEVLAVRAPRSFEVATVVETAEVV